ncbi:MAG: hypothetical protein LBK57_01555 [Clostridiales Family XIII bacterium]|jgi:hypothetical protein|nr:hypothetical protein [Clostridiales Family XIII bacterium]
MMGRGGRGGGFGGGGRSFGGGNSGGRSFGHVSSSSRGGFTSGGRAGRSGGGSSPGRSSGSPFIFFGGGRSYGGRYGSGNRGPSPYSAVIVVVIIIIILAVAIAAVLYSDGSSVPASTYQREPLVKGIALETEYLKDDVHWISNVSGVERSMRYFYDKTGVMPYLWITDSLDGDFFVSDDEAETALNALYDEEISDEGHIVILFLETSSSDYDIYYVAGTAASTVFDQEACDILIGYFDRYYYSDYDENEYFSKVFTEAADRIMTKTLPTGLILICVAAALVALICVFAFILAMVKRVNERKRLNAEILNTPIDEDDAFNIEDDADKAAKKYD